MNTNHAKTKAMSNTRSSSGNSYVYVSYVYDYVAGYIAVIDPASDEIIRTVIAGFDPGPMCMDIEEKRLYVLSSQGRSVTVFDTNTFDNLATYRIGETNNSYPVALLASPLGGKLYVADSGEKTVVIIDTTHGVTKDVDVGPGKPFAFASNKNSNFIYAACKVADGEDYVVAISLEEDIAFPYGKEMGLTFYEGLNPWLFIRMGTPKSQWELQGCLFIQMIKLVSRLRQACWTIRYPASIWTTNGYFVPQTKEKVLLNKLLTWPLMKRET